MTQTGHALADRLIVLADQGQRDAWLAARRGGLGGSDVSAICGENPYKRAIDVYDEQVHPEWAEERRMNMDRLEMGQVLEPVVLGLYVQGAPHWPRLGGPRMVWRPPLVAVRGREWQRGSADGLGIDAASDAVYIQDCGAFPSLCPPPGYDWWDEVAEVKTHGYHGSLAYSDKPFDDEPAPPDKVIQGAWYGDIWKPVQHRVSLLALVDTHIRRYFPIAIDPELVADLLTIAEDFWNSSIIAGIEPSPDGSERWNQHLKRKFRTSRTGAVIRATPDLDEAVAELRASWLASKDIETRLDKAKQVIQNAMGDHEIMQTHLGDIRWPVGVGRVKLRSAIDALYEALAWKQSQRAEHEAGHVGEPVRVFNVPHTKWKPKK